MLQKLKNWMLILKHDQKGQGMVEYGLIIALVAIGLVVALGLLTGSLQGVFGRIQAALEAA